MKGIIMSEDTPVYQDGETVPVPDKGGWIDGETGAVFGGPPPPSPKAEPASKTSQPGVVQPIRKADPPKKAS